MKLEVLEYLSDNHSTFPPLLFVHGGSHGAWCWKEHFLPYFAAQGFSAYAPSFRGHGASEGHEKLDSYVLEDYIEDVLSVIKQLPSPPVLVGHSLGGAVVQRVLQEHPEKLKAVVFLASSQPYGMTGAWMKVLVRRFKPIYELYLFNTGKRSTIPEGIVDMFFSPELSQEKRDAYTRLLQREATRAAEAIIRQNIHPGADQVGLPILVLGSKKDRFFSAKIAQHVARAYQTTPTILPNLCHDMMLDPHWQTAADAILHFLRTEVC